MKTPGQLNIADCKRAQDPNKKEEVRCDGGGLNLVLKNWTSVSWVFRYEQDRKPGKIGLGPFPDVPLAVARHEAAMLREKLRKGEELEGARERRRKAMQKALKASPRKTVAEAFEFWKAAVISKPEYRVDCGREADRTIRKDAYPVIGHKPIDTVTVEDISDIMAAIEGRANKEGSSLVGVRRQMLIDLRGLFKYAKLRGWVPLNVLDGYDLETIGCRQPEGRARYLSHDELIELTQKMDKVQLWPAGVRAIWIILATLCRIGELSKAEWAHVDFEARTWTIPPENYKKARKRKNKTPHVIHLSDFALREFRLQREANPTAKYVFQSRRLLGAYIQRGPFETFVRDMQVTERRRGGPGYHPGALILSGGGWVLHDLRRTGATTMGDRLNIDVATVERCLNHSLSGLSLIYQRGERLEQRKEAYDSLGRYLTAMQAEALADKVVGLRKAA